MYPWNIGLRDCRAVFPHNGHGTELLKFPTAIAQSISPPGLPGRIARDGNLSTDGRRFLVAEAAKRRTLSTQSYNFMLDYAPLFAYYAVEQGKIVREGTTTLEKQGITQMANTLKTLIQAESQGGRVKLSDAEAINAIRTGKYTCYGGETDCSKLVLEITSSYGDWLCNELSARHKEMIRGFRKIILGGGGAYLIKNRVPQRYANMIFVPPQPEFSNARGYLKFVRFEEEG